jgi:hypothetical protein
MSDSEGESDEKKAKVVLVGDGSAGKVDAFVSCVYSMHEYYLLLDIHIRTFLQRCIQKWLQSNIWHRLLFEKNYVNT